MPSVDLFPATFTIAASGTTSNTVALERGWIENLIIPSGWTAANLTFLVGRDAGTMYALYDVFGDQITLTVSASGGFKFPIDLVRGWDQVALVSSVAQASAVTLPALLGKAR